MGRPGTGTPRTRRLKRNSRPTRRELTTYTTVALAFIVVMVAIVTSLDYGFTKLIIAVFG